MPRPPRHTPEPPTPALERARAAYSRGAWDEAYRTFAQAEATAPLEVADLERLTWSAALTGRDRELLKCFERLHHAHQAAGDGVAAAYWAFWLGFRLLGVGEVGQATAWLGRADRLLLEAGRDCVEQGYVLLPAIHRHVGEGDLDAALAAASRAAGIGLRFSDGDLVALARSFEGMVLQRQGRIAEGLAVLDEAMLAAMADERAPLIRGLIYCTVIECCRRVYALGRAREWTAVLENWCDAQPELVTFTGTCRAHRAEILQLQGEWGEAIAEARRAADRFSDALDTEGAGPALYQQAEILRLRGEFAAAEKAYHEASRLGRDPHPGLALLRLAQRQSSAAASAIRRVLDATKDPMRRTRYLPAEVEILLAEGKVDEAREAAEELERIAAASGVAILGGIAAHARGAVLLAEGDARGALAPLRHALESWRSVEAPYLAARIRVLIGHACRALGDEEGARLECDAARAVFAELGAAPDLARLEAPATGEPARATSGLTARELQVLRLLARGGTNKAMAAELFLSEKTVDRHVSNIFAKLGVATRAAATAHAYDHGLL